MVVKICGIRTPAHALTAARAGADMIGLVFAPSRRQVSPEEAADIASALREDEAGQQAWLVGVFLHEQIEQINAVAARCGLDYVQVHGESRPEDFSPIRYPLMKSLGLVGAPGEHIWLTLTANPEQSGITFAPCPLHIDAQVAGASGGTGMLANWSRATELARHQRLMLAGGLTPDNVATAIAQVRPWGVDVSSGVERDGTKDDTLIEQFIQAARSVV
jgi:phosphoribosylanthranilate isomerase